MAKKKSTQKKKSKNESKGKKSSSKSKKKSKKKEQEKNKDGKELQEGEFVELDYVGREKGGDVFDTNVEEEAEEMGLDIEHRPVAICLGQNMILPAIDEFLVGKKIGKEYTLELEPENAFGKRKKDLIETMPMRVFREHDINPRPGMSFNFDNRVGKIRAVSGGRVIVDFNNPMASKDLVYTLKPKRKIKDKSEQVKVLMKTLLRKEFPFEIEDHTVKIETDQKSKQFIQAYKQKFEEILDMSIEVEEKESGSDQPEEDGDKQEDESEDKQED